MAKFKAIATCLDQLRARLDSRVSSAYPLHRRGIAMRRSIMFGLAAAVLVPLPILAHPGGLNSEGCHNNRKTGGYHCHRSASPRAAPSQRQGLVSMRPSGGAFANCSAARAAGTAPVRRGSLGYGTHLDRDGDGVGCE